MIFSPANQNLGKQPKKKVQEPGLFVIVTNAFVIAICRKPLFYFFTCLQLFVEKHFVFSKKKN